MRSQRVIAVTILVGCLFGLTAKSALADAELLFHDDFQSGDLSRHNANFRWGRSGVPSPGSGSSLIKEISGPNGEPVKALRFRYLGTVDRGASGDDAHFSEMRFHLTAHVDETRSSDGESQVAHPEIWARYDMRIPDNYHHALKDGTIPRSNQKGWIHFWKDSYRVNNTVMQRFEWWPVAQEHLNGQSTVSFLRRGQASHNVNPDYVRPDYAVPGLDRAWAISENDYGRWIDYGFRVKVASAKGAKDGVAEIYVDGVLALRWENVDSWPDDNDPQKAGFDRGYLMGYHNSAYEQTTDFYLTNFRIGTSAAAVGLHGAGTGKQRLIPNPPTVELRD